MKITRHSLLLTLLSITSTYAQLWIDAESGLILGTPYNKISISNTGGTRFDLGKEFKIQPIAFYRLRLGYTFNYRHTITALYAPLTANYEGAFDRTVTFNQQNFAPNQPITAKYQFNSYRLT